MKEELITGILQDMTGKMSVEQIGDLKVVLYMQLHNLEIIEKSTAVACVEKSYLYYLNMFLARKETEGKTAKTIKHYHLLLSMLLHYLNKDIKDIGEDDLFCYLVTYKRDRTVSNVYLDHMRLVFSSFFTWLNAKQFIIGNPTAGLEPIKADKKIKKPLSDEELEALRCSCIRERDLSLIELLYSTGMRVDELARLNLEDINFVDKEVIVFGKGAKERETYMNAKACMHLKTYIDSRMDDNSALFLSANIPHQRLTISGIENIVKQIGAKVGIDKVHPHRFRRTMATNALKKGMPIEEVKELLAHTKLDTTMIYCTVSKDNVKHSHQKYMCA